MLDAVMCASQGERTERGGVQLFSWSQSSLYVSLGKRSCGCCGSVRARPPPPFKNLRARQLAKKVANQK